MALRVCLQRVASAGVSVEAEPQRARIGRGFVALVGVTHGDTPRDSEVLAAKVAGLRVFPDAEGKMNLSLTDIDGEVLAISQFTLYADCRRGRRPSFTSAADPTTACELYEDFVENLRARGIEVATGVFGAHMKVELVNDGPVTILLETLEGNLI